jgi:hypothetical protein
LARILIKKCASHISLPHVFNIKIPTQIITDLNEIPVDNDLKFASSDISNMYFNFHTTELIHIIAKICDQQCLPHHIQQEILSLSNTLLDPNYFCYQDTIYRQTEGPAVGAPTSSLFSEIYLQHLEGTRIFDILAQHQIVGCFRFVDDILIAYRQSLTNIHEVLTKFNNLTPIAKFHIRRRDQQQHQLPGHHHYKNT